MRRPTSSSAQYSPRATSCRSSSRRGFATTGLGEVPTAREAGFPDLDVVGWHGLSGPKGLPASVVARWNALIEEAAKDPAFREQAAKVNKVLAYKGPDAFWKFQEEELTKYLPLATKMGIRK